MATLVHEFTPLLVLTEDTETGRITARLDFFNSAVQSGEVNAMGQYVREFDLDDPEPQDAAAALDAYLAGHPALTATVIIRASQEV
jgi:hypothetical protein